MRYARTITLCILCMLLLTFPVLALTAMDAAGTYAYKNGVYTPAQPVYRLGDTLTALEPVFSEGLAAICVEGKWGYAARDGRIVIEPAYDSAGRFSEGYAPVSRNGKNLFIDVTGKTVIDASAYDEISPFSEGFARVRQDGLYGFINAHGNVAVAVIYEAASDFSDGLVAVQLDGKYGYITAAGRTAIPFDCDFAGDFADGLAYVESAGVGKLINKAGTVIAENVYGFSEGLALFQSEDGWGFVDATGAVVITPTLQDAELPSEGFIGVSVEGVWGYMDYSGHVVIEPQWDAVWPFSGDAALVGTLSTDLTTIGTYRYISRLGLPLNDETYKAAQPFSDGLAAVSNGKKWGYIDLTGALVVDYLYDCAAPFEDGLALVAIDGIFSFIDETGTTLSFYTGEA
ncbi:MAG: hypothetical protein GX929_09755, partial [Clostridiales bacterium]|nr:hypothetical protein [Clostridiales bacterium]